jgi:hypothetical protein
MNTNFALWTANSRAAVRPAGGWLPTGHRTQGMAGPSVTLLDPYIPPMNSAPDLEECLVGRVLLPFESMNTVSRTALNVAGNTRTFQRLLLLCLHHILTNLLLRLRYIL